MDKFDIQIQQLKMQMSDTQRLSGPMINSARSDSISSIRVAEGNTAVFGGFKGATNKEELDEWLREVLWNAGAEYPLDTYIKGDMGDFNGIMFGKYPGNVERETVVKKVRESRQEFGGQKVWAKADQPLEARVAQSVLFAAKNMMKSKEWGFDGRSLWVDTDKNWLTCGQDDTVLKVSVNDSKLLIEYGEGWEAFIVPDNNAWTEIIKDAEAKLAKQRPLPTKGLGKGKKSGTQY